MYQLNPLLEGNGPLSTSMNLARRRMVTGSKNWSQQLLKDPNTSKFRKVISWLGDKVNRINNSKPFHKLDRSGAAMKLREVRRADGSIAGRAYRDYLTAKTNNKTWSNSLLGK